jgi:hypothetical protein
MPLRYIRMHEGVAPCNGFCAANEGGASRRK